MFYKKMILKKDLMGKKSIFNVINIPDISKLE